MLSWGNIKRLLGLPCLGSFNWPLVARTFTAMPKAVSDVKFRSLRGVSLGLVCLRTICKTSYCTPPDLNTPNSSKERPAARIHPGLASQITVAPVPQCYFEVSCVVESKVCKEDRANS